MKKYIAECLGTFVLTFLGCGTAMFLGCNTPAGVLGTAIAFGLTVIAMAYTIGNISGCHINPAITLGVALAGRMPVATGAARLSAVSSPAHFSLPLQSLSQPLISPEVSGLMAWPMPAECGEPSS